MYIIYKKLSCLMNAGLEAMFRYQRVKSARCDTYGPTFIVAEFN